MSCQINKGRRDMDKAEKPNKNIYIGGLDLMWDFDHSVSINHLQHSTLGCLVETHSHYMYRLLPPHEIAVQKSHFSTVLFVRNNEKSWSYL